MVNTPTPMMLPITSPVAEVRPMLRSGGPPAGTASAGLPDGSGTGWGLAAITITLD